MAIAAAVDLVANLHRTVLKLLLRRVNGSIPMHLDNLRSTTGARRTPAGVRPPTATADGWLRTTLGDCASLVGDKVDPVSCEGMPYIGLEHIGKGTLTLLGTGRAQDVQSTKFAFRAGDILFGKLRPYFRKVVRPSFDGICSTDIWVVRPRAGVDAGYLSYLMASKAFVDFASQGSEGTRMPRAKWDYVARYPFHIPPLAEQSDIGRILGALSNKIELSRRMAETLQETLRTLLPPLMAGQVRAHDAEKIVKGAK